MDEIIKGFLKRNLPEFVESFNINIDGSSKDYFSVTADDGMVNILANCVTIVRTVGSGLSRMV